MSNVELGTELNELFGEADRIMANPIYEPKFPITLVTPDFGDHLNGGTFTNVFNNVGEVVAHYRDTMGVRMGYDDAGNEIELEPEHKMPSTPQEALDLLEEIETVISLTAS